MLAIALGDPTGIGPEVALKAVAAELPRDDGTLPAHWRRQPWFAN